MTFRDYAQMPARLRDDVLLVRERIEAAQAVQAGAFVPGRFSPRADSLFNEGVGRG